MMPLLPTKFHEILFSGFRGVALTNCVTDRRTNRTKTICLPTKVGGDITIEVSVLISCIASICHVYMKFPLKIKDSTFLSHSFGKK